VARRQGNQASHDRAGIERTIADLEVRIERARDTIDTYDRPLSRRRHAEELVAARNELGWIPRSLERERGKLRQAQHLETQADRSLLDALDLARRRPELLAEQAIVRHRLAEDARARGDRLAAHAPALYVEHLGPVPTHAAELTAWKAAA